MIGDIMLDRFVWGESHRISPEAPVPVIVVNKETSVPGGAGNVASNISALGGEAILVGVIGDDMPGNELLQKLSEHKAGVSFVEKVIGRPTTEKSRIIVSGQQMARVDREESGDLLAISTEKLKEYIKNSIQGWDALVISDYAKGVITKDMIEYIVSLAQKHNKPIVGDIKPKHASYCKNITILTSNVSEVLEASELSDVIDAGKMLQEKLNAIILVTQASDGMLLFEEKTQTHFPAHAEEVYDVAGAGDTVTAAVALSLASNLSGGISAHIANTAAGIVVNKVGVATVLPEELKETLLNYDNEKEN